MPFSKTNYSPIKVLVGLGILLSSTVSAIGPAAAQTAPACQNPGCLLPVRAQPLSVAPEPVAPAPIVEDIDDGKTIGWLPILLALLAAGALAYFLFIDDDDEPESP
jgi:hypothetical protein